MPNLLLKVKMEMLSKILMCSVWKYCAMYVCNACSFDSSCLDCCEIHFVTDEIELSSDDGEEIDVDLGGGCCLFRKKR